VTAGPRILANFVNGGYAEPEADATSDIVSPVTAQVVATAPVSSAADVDRAYAAAAAAFEVWGQTTPGERQHALLKFADAVESRADELVRLEAENTGKPYALTASEELPPMVDQIRFFAGAARVLEGRAAGEYLRGHTSWVRREPIGVIGQVTPWNYPMMMAIWKIAPALAAGNTVVLKPSDTTPETTLLLAEIASEFLPPGTFNVVTGDRDTGRAVVQHKTPAMVSITGSVRAGIQVAESASHDLKRVHLELGGKAPVVVFDDADLQAAIDGIGAAGYFNAGQDCTAATRVIAGPRIHDDFVDALSQYARSGAKVGLPDDEEALFGPVNNAGQLAQVEGFLSRLPDHASIRAGGSRVSGLGDGYFFEPTVLSGLRQDDEAIQREIFGPVITGQQCLDQGLRPGHADVAKAGLRLRVDQHPYSDRGRDAPRRLQAQRLRQGPVDVRIRGLHPNQARDGQHRRIIFSGMFRELQGLAWSTRLPHTEECS